MSEGSKPPKAPPVQVTQVKIVDVDIPFDSLIKLAVGAIPALLVAGLFIGLIAGLIVGAASWLFSSPAPQ
jgi:hypothetical protein